MNNARSHSEISPGWIVGILAVVTFILYWHATHCGFLNFDDNVYVWENPHTRAGLTWAGLLWSFTHAVSSNWHPLTLISYMVDERLFGMGPGGFHFTNILFHSFNAGLLYLLLWMMTGARWRALFVAAFFAFHPLRAESVVWVAERKDVLSGFFGLLTLLFYVRYARTPRTGSTLSRFSGDYLLSLLCFLLGLMSKPMLVTWPFVMLTIDYWPLHRTQKQPGSNLRSNLYSLFLEKIPFFILIIISSVVTFLVQKNTGAMKGTLALPFADRAGNAIVAYCRYLGMTFWPVDLAIMYPHPGHWPAIEVILSALLLLVITVGAIFVRRKLPFLLVGWLWFLGTLVPVIGLIQVGSQSLADRYTYLPCIGLFIAIVWSAGSLLHGMPSLRVPLALAGFFAMLACAVLTRHQIGFWISNETIFRHAIASTDDNYLAHTSLASAFRTGHRYEEALAEYRAALRIYPGFASARYGAGLVLMDLGHTVDGLGELTAAVQADPTYAPSQADLGIALVRLGRFAEARAHLDAALRLDPDLPTAYNALGSLLDAEGQPARAIGEYQHAVDLNPYFAEAHNNLALSLARAGRNDDAMAELRRAIQIDPTLAEPHNSLGQILGTLGHVAEAVPEFQEALRLNPNLANAHNNLGTAYAVQGRRDDAMREYREALRIDPGNPDATRNLARLTGSGAR